MGGTKKRRGEAKILKRGDKLGQGVGALKKGSVFDHFLGLALIWLNV